MTRRVLIFGDSNTHGTMPDANGRSFGRYEAGIRWPSVAADLLAPDWTIIDDGLPGRTTQEPDPIMGSHMDGREGLKMALGSQTPLDVVAIMLGTNDLKARFGASVGHICAGIAGLIDIIRNAPSSLASGSPQVLVIAPAQVNVVGPRAAEWTGSAAKSAQFAEAMQVLAENYDCGFLDAGHVDPVDAEEGIHWTAEGHQAFGRAFAAHIKAQYA